MCIEFVLVSANRKRLLLIKKIPQFILTANSDMSVYYSYVANHYYNNYACL